MELPGIVNNITNFGCFVDIGIKEKGLVHVSQLADKFVSDPTTVVSIHQHVRGESDEHRPRAQAHPAHYERIESIIATKVKKNMEEDIEPAAGSFFYKDQLLIEKKNGMYTIPFGTEPPMPVPVGSTIHTIGEIEGRTAKTFSVHAPVPGSENDRHLMMDLRSSYDVLPWEEYNVGGKAFQILNWDKNSRYCPMCGVPTVQISPIAKKCPQCRQEIYPRISPAIIVLIRREDSILLVHARNFRGPSTVW